ncbi:MAG: hypothetical protein ABIL06_19345 [Pseudomonadota bacterium]|uniref:Uncharacterized protein n=1 Tax=viral metagenome TaxID=1070528 RepID=A0A6M3XZQ7_9ZZZZ
MESEGMALLKEIKNLICWVIIAQMVSTIAIVMVLGFIYNKLSG